MTIAELPRQSVPSEGPRKGLQVERFFTTEGVHPYDEVEWERRDAKIGGGEGGTVFEQKGVEVPKFWSMTASGASSRWSTGSWIGSRPGASRAAISFPTGTSRPSTTSSST